MKKITNLIGILSILTMIVYTGGYLFGNKTEYIHSCSWENCELNGKKNTDVFVSVNKPSTDEYYVDMIHWVHPDWSKEKCLQQIYTHIKTK